MRRALAEAWKACSGVLAVTAVAGLVSGSYPWYGFLKFASIAAVGLVLGRLARTAARRRPDR
jgi:hypothetical protein